MSQKKVEQYKAEKLNRKETLKKKKRQAIVAKSLVGLVVIAFVGMIGYEVYNRAIVNAGGTNANTVDIKVLDEYLQGLDSSVAMGVFEEDEDAAVGEDVADQDTAATDTPSDSLEE